MFRSLVAYTRPFVTAAIAACAITMFVTSPSQAQIIADKPACAVAHNDAKVLQMFADYPELARVTGAHGSALVEVTLSSTGSVTKAAIATSSGTRTLDEAAVRAVLAGRFAPEVSECAQIGGTYLVQVDWE